MSGSKWGRPLTAKTRAIAAGWNRSAPSPYTVSVGNAPMPPVRNSSAARDTWAGDNRSATRPLAPGMVLPRSQFVNHLNKCLHVGMRDIGRHPVPKVEDVPRPTLGGCQDLTGSLANER